MMNEELFQKMAAQARVVALKKTDELGEIANSMGRIFPPIPMWSLLSTMILQNVIMFIVSQTFKPGSEEGAKVIKQMYDSAANDAIARWNVEMPKESSVLITPGAP